MMKMMAFFMGVGGKKKNDEFIQKYTRLSTMTHKIIISGAVPALIWPVVAVHKLCHPIDVYGGGAGGGGICSPVVLDGHS